MSKQEKPHQQTSVKPDKKDLPDNVKKAVEKKQEYNNKPIYK
jgi:hypothetical protein